MLIIIAIAACLYFLWDIRNELVETRKALEKIAEKD